jgi:hypothetical protein
MTGLFKSELPVIIHVCVQRRRGRASPMQIIRPLGVGGGYRHRSYCQCTHIKSEQIGVRSIIISESKACALPALAVTELQTLIRLGITINNQPKNRTFIKHWFMFSISESDAGDTDFLAEGQQQVLTEGDIVIRRRRHQERMHPRQSR